MTRKAVSLANTPLPWQPSRGTHARPVAPALSPHPVEPHPALLALQRPAIFARQGLRRPQEQPALLDIIVWVVLMISVSATPPLASSARQGLRRLLE